MKEIQPDNSIVNQNYDGLKIKQLTKNDNLEVLCVSLEKGTMFPKHESHVDAQLIVLEGHITFYIENHPIVLKTHQQFKFPKDTAHWVEAYSNSKFLIIR